jgi:hypothetical protein
MYFLQNVYLNELFMSLMKKITYLYEKLNNFTYLEVIKNFLSRLSKGNVTFCHHLAFIVQHPQSVRYLSFVCHRL